MEHIEKHLRATNNETTQKRVWETVTRRKNKNVRTAIAGNEGTIDYRTDNREKITDNRVRRRPPKTVGVAIKGEEGFSYADALKKARTEISLKEIGIDTTKIRRATNGGIIIEIPGAENKEKANVLVQKLKQILLKKAKITRPSIKGELRVIGFDESVKKEEIREIMTEMGECEYDEINIGDIRPMRNGLFMTWARCPLAATVKIANNGKIKLG
ncbi:CCHC-type domain-containing protein [Camponotus japonicus]